MLQQHRVVLSEQHYYCITDQMFTSWYNLDLDKYSCNAKELDVNLARKNLDRLPIGKIWFRLIKYRARAIITRGLYTFYSIFLFHWGLYYRPFMY